MRAYVHKVLEKISPFWEQDEYTKIEKNYILFCSVFIIKLPKKHGSGIADHQKCGDRRGRTQRLK